MEPAGRLKVALVTETFPPEVNGVAMTLGTVVEGLLKRGHHVQLLRPRQSRQDQPSQRDRLLEVLTLGIPIPNYKGLRFGLASHSGLLKRWRETRPDIVHVATEGPLGWSAVRAARSLQLPLSSSFHTNFQNYSGHYHLSLLKGAIDTYLRKLHNSTQATLVPTTALRAELAQRGYANLGLMSRGVNTNLFKPSARSDALRRSWGLGPSDLAVIHVGRLAKEKNLGVIVSAFGAIQAAHPGARLVLVGDGPLRASLQASCPQAHFAGVRTGADLAQHYASGDFFLFSSLSETYGNVVPEAMASGLAVLAYGCAAAAELIESGHNGLLVPPDDAQAFVLQAFALAGDPARMTALRSMAARSVSHLAWDAVHDTFIDTLRSVIERHQASRPAVLATPMTEVLFRPPSA